ncbi:MAG: glycosyltransferase family 1 protein, partial [Candidatus Neomarinimicrobiota bacterium]
LHLFGHSLARARPRAPDSPARLHRLPIPGRSLGLLTRAGLGADRLSGSPSLFHWTDYVHPPVSRAATVLSLYDVSFAEDPSFHGPSQARVLAERTRRAASSSRLVIVPTMATRRAAAQHFGIAESVLRTVPLGVDHLPRDPGPDPLAGRPFVVTLGTIEPRKNHARMLEAWSQLSSPRPLLVVIGRPGWECTAAVEALRAGQRRGDLRWLRGADDQRAFRYLAHARAALYPSLLEGFGFPPLEAMSLGVPVLAGDTPALREVLEDCALFCDPTDVTSIAGCMGQLLEDQVCRSELIRAGRQRASCFTWARAAAGYVAAYQEASECQEALE